MSGTPSPVESSPASSTSPKSAVEEEPRARHARSAWLAIKKQELLTPVSAVVELADLLLKDAQERGNLDFLADLGKIQAAGKRLLALITETLGSGPGVMDDSAFGPTIRHELRTPLNHIIGYCELWIEAAPDFFLDSLVPDLQRIRALGQQTLHQLDEIVHFTKAAGGRAAGLQAAELSPEIRGVVASFLESGQAPRRAALRPAAPVLVVDDNEINRDVLCRWLRHEGYPVAEASNGRQALELVRAQPFDLVLLDVIMPELNGFQVLEQLKADPNLRHLPVIVISALEETDSVVRCIEMGAEDYLTKPFNQVLLRARLEACMEKKVLRDREILYLEQIRKEQERADELLHVILPGEIVKELKATNAILPRRHGHVAVLFCDIVGFTPYCDQHQPEQVVSHLQQVIETWEETAQQHGVEKIKTVGDAFMAAAGLLRSLENPVLACVRCGLDILAQAQQWPVPWQVRIGIHVGPVIAGVIGRRQFLFDLWGDTVNTAARMESHGIPNSLTLSRAAWEEVKPFYQGHSLGMVPIKGKGPMEMFRLDRLALDETSQQSVS